MKIGSIKVKRNYQIAQMALDAVAALILTATVQCVISFGEFITSQNQLILSVNSEIKGLVVWQWNLVWIAAAAAVVAVSLVMIYKNKKMPKKYIVNEANAQKYSDIVITAITCVRIPALLAVFELMAMHQSIMTGNTRGIFTLQIPLDILLSVIIIRFSAHRIKAIQPKPEEKEIRIKEN
ncbi:MAG: hypothetical protein NC394_00210 [Bacteroides sp.]|nr:hypothetical protein [Bacteroides sp.]